MTLPAPSPLPGGAGLDESAVDARIELLAVDAAPALLNTLNEVAASIGDDDDFAGTMTTALATKATPAQTWTWDAVTAKTGGYSFALGDEGTLFTMGANNDFTVPNNADEGFAVGATIGVLLLDGFAGDILDASSVTLNGETTGAGVLAMVPHQMVVLTKVATDDWNVSGV